LFGLRCCCLLVVAGRSFVRTLDVGCVGCWLLRLDVVTFGFVVVGVGLTLVGCFGWLLVWTTLLVCYALFGVWLLVVALVYVWFGCCYVVCFGCLAFAFAFTRLVRVAFAFCLVVGLVGWLFVWLLLVCLLGLLVYVVWVVGCWLLVGCLIVVAFVGCCVVLVVRCYVGWLLVVRCLLVGCVGYVWLLLLFVVRRWLCWLVVVERWDGLLLLRVVVGCFGCCSLVGCWTFVGCVGLALVWLVVVGLRCLLVVVTLRYTLRCCCLLLTLFVGTLRCCCVVVGWVDFVVCCCCCLLLIVALFVVVCCLLLRFVLIVDRDD